MRMVCNVHCRIVVVVRCRRRSDPPKTHTNAFTRSRNRMPSPSNSNNQWHVSKSAPSASSESAYRCMLCYCDDALFGIPLVYPLLRMLRAIDSEMNWLFTSMGSILGRFRAMCWTKVVQFTAYA